MSEAPSEDKRPSPWRFAWLVPLVAWVAYALWCLIQVFPAYFDARAAIPMAGARPAFRRSFDTPLVFILTTLVLAAVSAYLVVRRSGGRPWIAVFLLSIWTLLLWWYARDNVSRAIVAPWCDSALIVRPLKLGGGVAAYTLFLSILGMRRLHRPYADGPAIDTYLANPLYPEVLERDHDPGPF